MLSIKHLEDFIETYQYVDINYENCLPIDQEHNYDILNSFIQVNNIVSETYTLLKDSNKDSRHIPFLNTADYSDINKYKDENTPLNIIEDNNNHSENQIVETWIKNEKCRHLDGDIDRWKVKKMIDNSPSTDKISNHSTCSNNSCSSCRLNSDLMTENSEFELSSQENQTKHSEIKTLNFSHNQHQILKENNHQTKRNDENVKCCFGKSHLPNLYNAVSLTSDQKEISNLSPSDEIIINDNHDEIIDAGAYDKDKDKITAIDIHDKNVNQDEVIDVDVYDTENQGTVIEIDSDSNERFENKENESIKYNKVIVIECDLEDTVQGKAVKNLNNDQAIEIDSEPDEIIVIDSDCDDEFLQIPFSLLQKTKSNESNECTSKETPMPCRNATEVFTRSSLTLDKILGIRKEEREKMLLLEAKDKEVISDDTAGHECKDADVLKLIKSMNFKTTIQTDRTVNLPPGLNVLNVMKAYQYFCAVHGLSVKNCDSNMDRNNLFERDLMKLSAMELQEVISYGTLNSTSNKAILEYAFKSLSVQADSIKRDFYQKLLCSYIKSFLTEKTGTFFWCPSMKDFLTVVLNYGITITDDCPVKNLLLDIEKSLTVIDHKCSVVTEESEDSINETTSLIIDNLIEVLETLSMFLCCKCNYAQEEICDFILLLCWLSLDTRLIEKFIKVKIGQCIAASLENISSSDWPDKMKYLSEQLAELGGHHRNALYVVTLLPESSRGVHLRKAVSFLAIQYLLKSDNACFVADVTPFVVLELLKLYPLYHVSDYFLLHTIICLTNFCIENKVSPLYRSALEEICMIMMETHGKIKETYLCLDGSQVKNLLVQLNGKFIAIIQALPYRKTSIFKYSSQQVSTEKLRIPSSEIEAYDEECF